MDDSVHHHRGELHCGHHLAACGEPPRIDCENPGRPRRRFEPAPVNRTSAFQYLSAQHVDARIFPTVADGLAALKAGKLDAFVYDRPILEWVRRKDFPDDVTVLETVFARENYAITVPENSPLRLKINQAMLGELRTPGWQEVLQRYLGGAE